MKEGDPRNQPTPAPLPRRFGRYVLLKSLARGSTGELFLAASQPAGHDEAMDAAQCIGCGACVAACKNASAMLFVAAKVSHLALLPQGTPERTRRVLSMVKTMDEAGFGNCTITGSCEAVCPKEISLDFIARMNRDYLKASFRAKFTPEPAVSGGGGA